MAFTLEQACEEFFDNSGGGGICYGGTGQSGSITGNPTGGSGTGSSYPGSGTGTVVQPPPSEDEPYIDIEIKAELMEYLQLVFGPLSPSNLAEGAGMWVDFWADAIWDSLGAPSGSWDNMPGQQPTVPEMGNYWRDTFRDMGYGLLDLYIESMPHRLRQNPGEPTGPVDEPTTPPDQVAVGGFSVRSSFGETTVVVADGTSGNDRIEGVNWAAAGAGNDTVIGRDSADVLGGGDGNDTLIGGRGGDLLSGGLGFDTASYSNATSGVIANLTGGMAAGDAAGDVLVGIEGLIGTAFKDILTGSSEANLIQGGGGNDILVWSWGSDTLDGGAGDDTVVYDAAYGVTLDLSNNAANAGVAAGHVFWNIENAVGGSAGDALIGNGAANKLDGGAGADTLTGGWGSDTLEGGAGIDTARYDNTPYGVTVNLANSGLNSGSAAGDVLISIENVIGSSSGDILVGNDATNKLEAGGGDDMLTGGWGSDTLDGGGGVDTVRYDDTPYGVTVNLNNNALNTGAAAGDVLIGIENVIGSDAAADMLVGNAAANLLDGRFGHDTIDGGSGNDVLKGWYGWDSFVFSSALNGISNVDHLADFYAPDDVIHLDDAVFSGIGATGALSASAFTTGANATSASHKIVYNYATGELFFDADGSGAGARVKFATVQLGTTITASDFHIV
jgi:Ca2+-binding RTX toxin-like protein